MPSAATPSDPSPRSLLEVLPAYRAVFFDAYGVLRDAQGPMPDAAAAFEALKAKSVPYWVVTNDASRTPESLANAYGGHVAPKRMVSSGLLASDCLRRTYPGAKVGVLGPPASADLITRAGCQPLAFADTEDEDLDQLDVVALMDEAGFSWERELTRLVNLCRRRPDLEVLVPNPDVVYPAGGGRVGLAAGALSAILERATGRAPRSFGKPAVEIFQRALALAQDELADLHPAQILMVGDTPATDLAGARMVGLATALTLWGNTPPSEALRLFNAPNGPTHLLSSLV
jgi:HAD superfamily hydrolase (TIGR01450 family)